MNDAVENRDETQGGVEQTPVFMIQKIYTRNISVESPNAPAVFAWNFEPQLEVDLNVSSEGLDEAQGLYHVVVRVTVTVKLKEGTAFLVEVEQAGLFIIQGYGEADLGYILGVHCPNILFPYAREAVSDLVTRSGFPQLLLEPVNFEAMYADYVAQQAQNGEDAAARQ